MKYAPTAGHISLFFTSLKRLESIICIAILTQGCRCSRQPWALFFNPFGVYGKRLVALKNTERVAFRSLLLFPFVFPLPLPFLQPK
jgi:hypothetical protein